MMKKLLSILLIVIIIILAFQASLMVFPNLFLNKKMINTIVAKLNEKNISVDRDIKPEYSSGVFIQVKYKLNLKNPTINTDFSKYNLGLLSKIFKNKLLRFMNSDISELSKDKLKVQAKEVDILVLPFKKDFIIDKVDNISVSFLNNKKYTANVEEFKTHNFYLLKNKKDFNININNLSLVLNNSTANIKNINYNQCKSFDLSNKKTFLKLLKNYKIKYKNNLTIKNLNINKKFTLNKLDYSIIVKSKNKAYYSNLNLNLNNLNLDNSLFSNSFVTSKISFLNISADTAEKFMNMFKKTGSKIYQFQELIKSIKKQNPKININARLLNKLIDINTNGEIIFYGTPLIPLGKINIDINNIEKLKKALKSKKITKYDKLINKIQKNIIIEIKAFKPFIYINKEPITAFLKK